MSTGAWIAWGIALLVAIVGVVFAYLAWRRPKAPPAPQGNPPDLRLVRTGGIGSGTGAPREHIKAKLRLINYGSGEATAWQVVVVNHHGPAVTIGQEPRRGPRHMATEISWQHDGSTGSVPPSQHRDLDDWLYVEAPAGTARLGFTYSIRADGMIPWRAQMLVRFGSDPEGTEVLFLD